MHELRNEWSYWHFALHYFDVSMFASLAQSLTWAAPPHKQQYSMWRRRLKCFHEEVNTAAFLNTVYRCTWSNSTWGLFSSPLFTKLFISLFRSVFMSVFLCETTQAAFFSPAVNCLHPPLLLYSVAHMIHKNKDGVCPFGFYSAGFLSSGRWVAARFCQTLCLIVADWSYRRATLFILFVFAPSAGRRAVGAFIFWPV